MTNEINLNRLFNDIEGWHDRTFPDGDLYSAFTHLSDEMGEVEDEVHALLNGIDCFGPNSKEVAMSREALAGELADVLMLVIACAQHANVHLPTALEKKYQKNQQRTFTFDPDRGYAKGD